MIFFYLCKVVLHQGTRHSQDQPLACGTNGVPESNVQDAVGTATAAWVYSLHTKYCMCSRLGWERPSSSSPSLPLSLSPLVKWTGLSDYLLMYITVVLYLVIILCFFLFCFLSRFLLLLCSSKSEKNIFFSLICSVLFWTWIGCKRSVLLFQRPFWWGVTTSRSLNILHSILSQLVSV